jgi:predicted deacylase
MSELGMIDRSKPENRVKHIVENAAPGSGHMQVCNPSPCTGYFETALKPGDPIRAGELIGTVYPLDGSTPQALRSVQTGLMLVLRTFPKVLAGESVGVVLEV